MPKQTKKRKKFNITQLDKLLEKSKKAHLDFAKSTSDLINKTLISLINKDINKYVR